VALLLPWTVPSIKTGKETNVYVRFTLEKRLETETDILAVLDKTATRFRVSQPKIVQGIATIQLPDSPTGPQLAAYWRGLNEIHANKKAISEGTFVGSWEKPIFAPETYNGNGDGLTVDQLRSVLTARGKDSSGKKADLVARLTETAAA
jgi:hypothetical protein